MKQRASSSREQAPNETGIMKACRTMNGKTQNRGFGWLSSL